MYAGGYAVGAGGQLILPPLLPPYDVAAGVAAVAALVDAYGPQPAAVPDDHEAASPVTAAIESQVPAPAVVSEGASAAIRWAREDSLEAAAEEAAAAAASDGAGGSGGGGGGPPAARCPPDLVALAALHQQLARSRRVLALVARRERLRGVQVAAEQAAFHAARHALGDGTGLVASPGDGDADSSDGDRGDDGEGGDPPAVAVGGARHAAELAASAADHDAAASEGQALMALQLGAAAAAAGGGGGGGGGAGGGGRLRRAEFAQRLLAGATGAPSGLRVRIAEAMHPHLAPLFAHLRGGSSSAGAAKRKR